MDLTTELLREGHELTSFTSGRATLDHWLRQSALRMNVHDTGRTWVIHRGDDVVLGYYTLAAHALHRDSLPRKLSRSVPAEIPAILLAKLALDVTVQGTGLGKDLLLEALERCVNSGRLVASRFVVVDAIDDQAADFYEKYGFRQIPETTPTRLQRRLKDIAADLSAEES